jgi:acyl carrier protein
MAPRLWQTKKWLDEQAQAWARRYFPADQQAIAAAIARVLVEGGCADFETLAPGSRLIEDLDMTDLEPVEIIDSLQEEFSIEFTDEDCDQFVTVKSVIDYLHEKKLV